MHKELMFTKAINMISLSIQVAIQQNIKELFSRTRIR
jgi:hypothetical protein